MQPSMQVLEDWLVRLEDRLQDRHEEIAILRGQICRCGDLPQTPGHLAGGPRRPRGWAKPEGEGVE